MSIGVLDPTIDADAAQPTAPARPRNSLLRLWPLVRPHRVILGLSIVVAFVGTGTALLIPMVVRHVIDGPIARRDFAGVWWPAAGVLALGLIDALAVWLRRSMVAVPANTFETDSRMVIFRKLQDLSVGRHDGWDSGQLLSRAITDLSTLRRFIAFAAPFLVVNSLLIVTGAVVLASIAPILGVVMLAMAVPLIALCTHFEHRYRVFSRRAQEQSGDLATTVEETVHGIRVLKAFGRTGFQGRRFVREAATLRGSEMAKIQYTAWLWLVIVGLPTLAIGVMLAVATHSIVNGSMTTGDLVAAMAVVAVLLWPIESFGFLLAELGNSRTAADRFFDIIDLPRDIADPDDPQPLPPTVRGEVRFDAVDFAFPDSSALLLHDVNFVVHPGETVAVVGVTGSGKTALLSLLPRLYDVRSGSVTIDGIDVASLAVSDLRSLVAVAFEEPALFSASVRENITMGRPGVDDAQVWAALAIAQADGFVSDLPWGLATRIGEQGLSLSGGQRQRLALARAVIGNPRILVLDDPLSALDVGTEEKVHQALEPILAAATTLLVAHRPSTAALADRVVLLDGAAIAAQGTHEDLLRTSERYRHVMGGAR